MCSSKAQFAMKHNTLQSVSKCFLYKMDNENDEIPMTCTNRIFVMDLEIVLNTADVGDAIILPQLSRLGAGLLGIANNLKILLDKKLIIISQREGIDSSTEEGKRSIDFVLDLAGQIKDNLVQHTQKGLKEAIQSNKVKIGRKNGVSEKYLPIAENVYWAYVNKKKNKQTDTDIIKAFGIPSRTTLYKIVEHVKESLNKGK